MNLGRMFSRAEIYVFGPWGRQLIRGYSSAVTVRRMAYTIARRRMISGRAAHFLNAC